MSKYNLCMYELISSIANFHVDVCLARWPRLGDACLSVEIVTLLNSQSFEFKFLFKPKYHVKYYDYIVKWYSGIACNWCVSLDIA